MVLESLQQLVVMEVQFNMIGEGYLKIKVVLFLKHKLPDTALLAVVS